MTIEEKLLQVAGLCYEISTTTETDVFFDYYPHVNTYDVHYNAGGWKSGRPSVWMESSTHINDENLDSTIAKLRKLKAVLP